MKICGTVRRPEAWIIVWRRAGSAVTSISLYAIPLWVSRRLACTQ